MTIYDKYSVIIDNSSGNDAYDSASPRSSPANSCAACAFPASTTGASKPPRPFGVEFGFVPGKAQFHFVSRGPVLLRMVSGQRLLQSGDALFIPNGDGHVLLSDDRASVVNVSRLPSEPVCGSVSCVKNACDDAKSDSAIIFSACMDFELGGMQPLVKAMPEVMLVSSPLTSRPEIQPMLAAMERESLTRQAGYAGILARLMWSPR